MKCLCAVTLLALGLVAASPVLAQTQTQTVQELRIPWVSVAGTSLRVVEGTPAPQATFGPAQRRRMAGTVSRRRSVELSSDQVVISALNARGEELFRDVTPDPRILRSEGPGPNDELTGVVLYHANAEFLINVPDDPEISEIKLYHPRWNGRVFDLEEIAAIRLP